MRDKIYSPGRPPVWQRDQVQRFWVGIAKGLSSEDAALSVGASSPVGSRWPKSSRPTTAIARDEAVFYDPLNLSRWPRPEW
jgi:hypothetical protein